MKTATPKTKQAKVSATIQAEKKEVLSIIAKKANISPADILDSAIHTFISRNLDLLSATEKKKYKHLIYGQK